jgi:hypothetical protein
MEDAKRIAVAGYKQVLEDGSDLCDDEPDAEYSDHGEERDDSEMYAPDILDAKGKGDLSTARLSTAQANTLRAQSRVQSVQEPEQHQPKPVPSDNEDLSYEQARALRRCQNRKGRQGCFDTDLGKW